MTYVANEEPFSARGGLPLFLFDAVLYVIVRVRVSVMVRVRVWGFYMGDGAMSVVSSVGGGRGFLASISTYGNTERESVNHGQFKHNSCPYVVVFSLFVLANDKHDSHLR
jgi:hypothetical protein